MLRCLPAVRSLPLLPTVHVYEHIHEHHHFLYRPVSTPPRVASPVPVVLPRIVVDQVDQVDPVEVAVEVVEVAVDEKQELQELEELEELEEEIEEPFPSWKRHKRPKPKTLPKPVPLSKALKSSMEVCFLAVLAWFRLLLAAGHHFALRRSSRRPPAVPPKVQRPPRALCWTPWRSG